MRNKFDEQLEALHIELIKMGCLCETGNCQCVKNPCKMPMKIF